MKELNTALLECQRLILPIYKGNKGNYGGFSDYETIITAIRKPMLTNNLVLTHRRLDTVDTFWLQTRITHAPTGQYVEDNARLIPSKMENGAIGAALTYAKRYSTVLLLGIVTTDVDYVDSGDPEAETPGSYAISPNKSTSSCISEDEHRMLIKLIDKYPEEQSMKILNHYKISTFRELPKSAFQKVYAGISDYIKNIETAGKPSNYL